MTAPIIHWQIVMNNSNISGMRKSSQDLWNNKYNTTHCVKTYSMKNSYPLMTLTCSIFAQRFKGNIIVKGIA